MYAGVWRGESGGCGPDRTGLDRGSWAYFGSFFDADSGSSLDYAEPSSERGVKRSTWANVCPASNCIAAERTRVLGEAQPQAGVDFLQRLEILSLGGGVMSFLPVKQS